MRSGDRDKYGDHKMQRRIKHSEKDMSAHELNCQEQTRRTGGATLRDDLRGLIIIALIGPSGVRALECSASQRRGQWGKDEERQVSVR